MSNVVGLHGEAPPQPGEPNDALVNMLADLLEMAKSGRLQSLIATGFTSEGNRLGLWADFHINVYEMLGAINWLEHEYVKRHVEDVQ